MSLYWNGAQVITTPLVNLYSLPWRYVDHYSMIYPAINFAVYILIQIKRFHWTNHAYVSKLFLMDHCQNPIIWFAWWYVVKCYKLFCIFSLYQVHSPNNQNIKSFIFWVLVKDYFMPTLQFWERWSFYEKYFYVENKCIVCSVWTITPQYLN